MPGSKKPRPGGEQKPDWGKWQFVVTVIMKVIITPVLDHYWPGTRDGRLL